MRNSRGRTDPATCPNCRVAIASSNPNYVVREIIDELQVRCPNSTECNWMGRVKDLQGHDNTCMYEVIECDVEGCTHTCLRKDMANHLSDMNVKLQHMELKYDKKLKEMGKTCGRKMIQMETKLKEMETKYERKMQEYENRLQTMGGEDNESRKKRRGSFATPAAQRDRFDTAAPLSQFVVTGCGIDEINGVYSRDGDYDNVPKYVRDAQYRGRAVVFSLYRFQGTEWFISIVRGPEPRPCDDIDFYMAKGDGPLPPTDDWEGTDVYGVSPPPKVYPVSI